MARDEAYNRAEKIVDWLGNKDDALSIEPGDEIRAEDAVLRELHAFLKEKDPSFGGLQRIQNKRREFLWVHEKFAREY